MVNVQQSAALILSVALAGCVATEDKLIIDAEECARLTVELKKEREAVTPPIVVPPN